MGILSFFDTKQQKETPKLVGVEGFQGISISVDYSLSEYYKMYDKNAYCQMVIGKLMTYTTKDGYTIKRHKKEQDGKFDEMVIGGDGTSFIQRMVRDYEVTGNVYIYLAKTKGGTFVGMQILDPRYIKPVVTTTGAVAGYVQNLNGIRVFLPDEVYHLKTDTDIDNEIVGRSKMKTLLIELMTDEEASQSNLAFFTNNQTPSSIIILDDDVDFKDETQKAKVLAELKSMFNTGKHTGGKNHHRSAFAKGIKEIVKIQDKISDMEFLDLRKFTLDLVCGVYEVPKDILGYTETSNRSVGDAQGNNFDDTIQGKKHTISNFLTRIIREVLGIEYAFDFKIDEQALKVRNIKTAGEAWQSGVAKLNEAREIANLEPDLKRGDEYYQSKPAEVDPKKQKLTIK